MVRVHFRAETFKTSSTVFTKPLFSVSVLQTAIVSVYQFYGNILKFNSKFIILNLASCTGSMVEIEIGGHSC